MRRVLLVLGILCFGLTSAQARRATGYRHGHKLSIKLARCGGTYAEVHTAIAFRAMARAAEKDGIRLAVRSGYRSHAKQRRLYRKYRRGHGHLAAKPGYSKHESGRALDLYINHRVYAWLVAHAAKYGFRRTVRKEAWHWEYVGRHHPRRTNARRGHPIER
jgi:D-alanyl-D-alanine carboxypeptidase